MEENKNYVIEDKIHEKKESEVPMPPSIPTALLEEMRDLKASIKLLTSKLDDSTKEDNT